MISIVVNTRLSELFQTSSAPFIQIWTTLQYQWTLELLILHPASKLDFAVWLCDRPPVIAPLVHRPALYVCSLWYLQVQSNGNSLACKSRVNDENNRANNYKCNKTALFSNSNWFNLSWNKRSANILSDEIITPCSMHVFCIYVPVHMHRGRELIPTGDFHHHSDWIFYYFKIMQIT
jgi:hypothetical protein